MPFGEPDPIFTQRIDWDRVKDHSIPSNKIASVSNPPPPPVERNAPAMLVLRPGDKVLVCLHDDPSPEEAQEWARQLHGAFKGVEFTIAGGVAGLAVLGGGDRG